MRASEPTSDERSRAVWVVAGNARDADDLAEMLDMLGLSPREAREPGAMPEHAMPAQRQPRNRKLSRDELNDVLAPLNAEKD